VAAGRAGRDRRGRPGRLRRGPERALRELHDASRRLIRAETREEVCEVAVEAARRILGLPLNGLWLHDPEADALEPVAWSEQGVEEFGEPPAFPVDGSPVGRVFREGVHRVYDNVTAEAEPFDPDTRVRSELVLPLGEYGVMNASSPSVGAFDEAHVSLGRVLAANVETAIERADRLAQRRARRRELERQRDELRRLNRLNALIEEIIRSLVGAATREEIERTVCEQLGGSEFYVGAWILERGGEPGTVALRTETDVGVDLPERAAAPEPVVSALENGGLHVLPDLAEDERVLGSLREAAVEADARSCLVAPLAYADTVFGGGGNDVMFGNRGEDRIFAGPGFVDRLVWSRGNDLLDARDNRSNDRLFGGKNFDTCRTDNGDTTEGCER
jgi:GAF domain-containing protein